jgi:hypothetical protein
MTRHAEEAEKALDFEKEKVSKEKISKKFL